MLTKLRPRSAYDLMAALSLFIVLGGTSYAVATGSIDSREIKNNSVQSADVRNGTLTGRDIARSTLGQLHGARGQTGAPGPAGPRGPKGDTGAAGRSALTPLASGETIRGFVALDVSSPAAGAFFGATASYPIPLAAPPAAAYIDNLTAGERCTGTHNAPTAPPGTLCVYVNQASNPRAHEGGHRVIAASPFGFQVVWQALETGHTYFIASYAVTAP